MTDFDPATFGPPAVRVGTAERERAAAALSEHFAAGRLDLDEYDDRVGRAYAARTAGDLVTLFTDLPRPAPPAAPTTSRPRARPWLPVAIVAVLILAVAIVATTHFVPLAIFPVLLFVFLRGHRGGRRRSRI